MGEKLRCAILDDYQDVALASADWSRLAPSVTIERFGSHLGDEKGVAAALAPFEILVAMRERTPFPASLLERLPRLRLLVTTGMRNASIDMEAARRRGVVVCGTGGVVGSASELAWALLMALKRNLAHELENFRRGGERWQLSVGEDLQGRTLGIVGLGRLGARMAAYGRAFDMEVLGWSRNNSPERSAALGVSCVASLDELLLRSDVVSLHVTLNDETRGMIGARELRLMKPRAVIVNTARGPLIDEAALVEALRSGRIAGAALDVFDSEPLARDHPFRTLPNVAATPHLGYVTRKTYDIFYADAVENIAAFLAGKPMRVIEAP